jgi:tetratricopeptide (TPR) repeat protein
MRVRTCSIGFAVWVLGCASTPPASQTNKMPPSEAPLRLASTSSVAEVATTLPASTSALAEGAALLDGLGSHHRAVTASPDAQRYFDQGLRLTYAFNHDEAARSYAEGAVIDPSCAMCFWGAALTLGPNYNVPMLPDRAKAAWDAIERARALSTGASAKATPVEQALIGALAKRYKGPEPLDPEKMQPQSVAYADAMRDVAKKFPNDLDVQVLFAESMMDVNPWKLWSLDGKPAEGTEEIVATLEGVLARDANHPGANHYLIHAVEAGRPEKAVASAERLGGLMPGAGHIVHMPAHIFQKLGRYADASAANEKAVLADQAYMKKVKPPGYYPMYLGHNYGFLSFSASMEGRSAVSLAAARSSATAMPPAMMDMMPGMDFFIAEPILAMVRFGRWDELLAEPRPDKKYLVLTGFWLHGHGMALAAKGRLDDAKGDHKALVALAAAAPKELTAGNSPAKDMFALAAKVLEARIATLEKKKDALSLWEEAVKIGDGLAYSEPDDWFYPVRHFQGAALLVARKAKDAEAVYSEDLRRHPHNGWALFGVWKALEAQGKTNDAATAKSDFEKAWANADVKLTTSAL